MAIIQQILLENLAIMYTYVWERWDHQLATIYQVFIIFLQFCSMTEIETTISFKGGFQIEN